MSPDSPAVRLTSAPDGVERFAWFPDGRQLATTYPPTPDSVGLTLLIVDRATGTIVRTLSDDVAVNWRRSTLGRAPALASPT